MRALLRQIAHGDDMQAGCAPRPRQEHRAEFAGADQRYPQRALYRGALLQQTEEIHGCMVQ